MTLYSGAVGSCTWSLVTGELDAPTVDAFLSYLRTLAREVEPGEVVLDMLYDVPMPSPVQRRQIIEVLEDAERFDHVAGHALVVNSSMGRGLMTAINWMVRPSFEEKIFARPDDATAWLATRCPGLDTEALMRDIRRTNPSFRDLRW